MEKHILHLSKVLGKAAKHAIFRSEQMSENHFTDSTNYSNLYSIADLTGINDDVFPKTGLLTIGQCAQINESILNVYALLGVTITDLPQEIPAELLYKLLVSKWNVPFRYLELSGAAISFCTGDPETCPYGIYCSKNKNKESVTVPDRYTDFIPLITQALDAGNVCFLNPVTLELEVVSGLMLENPEAFYNEHGIAANEAPFQHLLWDHYFMIEPPEEDELCDYFEKFIEQIPDQKFRNKMDTEINSFEPYSFLNNLLIHSAHRKEWQQFKFEKLENNVINQLQTNMMQWPEKKIENKLEQLHQISLPSDDHHPEN